MLLGSYLVPELGPVEHALLLVSERPLHIPHGWIHGGTGKFNLKMMCKLKELKK
jgi:hypothetical protein